MAAVWSKKDIQLILQAILIRAEVAPDKIEIKREGKEVKISNIGCIKSYDKEKIYIVLRERNRDVYVSLDDHAGNYTPAEKFLWFDPDKDIKDLIDKVLALGGPTAVVTREALVRCLPEVLDIEAENALLVDKIPKT